MEEQIDVQDTWVKTADGLTLYLRIYGRDSAQPPVVCLPGLTRNHRDFDGLARYLAAAPFHRRVIAMDSRGRGNSDRDPDPAHYNLWQETQDVMAALDQIGVQQADFIGSSRGGLILHLLAPVRPALIRRIVLNDIGPRIDAEGLQHIKAYLSERPTLRSWEACANWLRKIHGEAFPILGANDWDEMARAIYREDGGHFSSDYDAAIASQITAIDFDKPIPEHWEQFESLRPFPLLIIRGEHSRLLSKATCADMINRHPDAREIVATGQGHTPVLHLDPLAATIGRFLT